VVPVEVLAEEVLAEDWEDLVAVAALVVEWVVPVAAVAAAVVAGLLSLRRLASPLLLLVLVLLW